MAFHERAVGSQMASESGLTAAKDLQREFARVFPSAELYGARLDGGLRDAIGRFVDEAKARGASADEVVNAMKEVARRAGFVRPDASRPLAALPADRFFTRAITACIETYYEGEDVASPSGSRAAHASGDPYFDLHALRALLAGGDEDHFMRAIATYVRSAHARGVSVEHVLTQVTRLLKASDDTTRPPTPDSVLRSHQLVIRGLLLAVYGDGVADAADAILLTPPTSPHRAKSEPLR